MAANENSQLASALIGAYADHAVTLPAADIASVSLADAMDIQKRVADGLGEKVSAFKVAILPDGNAISAPLFGSLVVQSGGRVPSPSRGLVGIEVELAVRFARDVTPEIAADPEALKASIGSVHMGIEIVGSRLDDRTKAGTYGGLADNSNSAGYAVSPQEWTDGLDIDGLNLTVATEAGVIYEGKAKLSFGGPLNVLGAYGQRPIDHFGGLKAGTLVTTGSLCGVVAMPDPAPRTVTAVLGSQQMVVNLG